MNNQIKVSKVFIGYQAFNLLDEDYFLTCLIGTDESGGGVGIEAESEKSSLKGLHMFGRI